LSVFTGSVHIPGNAFLVRLFYCIKNPLIVKEPFSKNHGIITDFSLFFHDTPIL